MTDEEVPRAAVQLDGLLDAWLIDDSGAGRALAWDAARSCQPGPDQWLWIHLDYTRADVRQWMREGSGLPELAVEALLQSETRPRCVGADHSLMVFLRGVNMNPGADPEDMVGIRLWVARQRIISLRMRRLLSIDDIRSAVKRGAGPGSPAAFLVMLIERLLERAGVVIEALYDKVDALEASAHEETLREEREQLADIRREAIALRRFLAPQREALNRLSVERSGPLDDVHRLQLREHADRLTRMVEDLDAARERAGVVHESLVSRVAEQTNERMYILSIIAAIFLPISFVTGLLGVNVGGIPGGDSALGFPVVVGLLAVIAGGLWLYFRSRHWF